jgi:hypothetical protein
MTSPLPTLKAGNVRTTALELGKCQNQARNTHVGDHPLTRVRPKLPEVNRHPEFLV